MTYPFARIWTSAPHEVDGFFVELIDKMGPKSKLDCQVDCEWLPTVEACKDWAKNHNVVRIEEL